MSRWLAQIRLTLRSLFNRASVDQELDEEFQDHLQREIEERLKSGLDPEAARYAALRAMGAIAKSKEESRDARRVNFIDDILRDLRYASRSMRRSPGFAALAVLIMALGIGANTAVFSVVNAVLLRPLPYRDPDRIVTLSTRVTKADPAQTALDEQISIPNFQNWHDQSSSFEAMAYYNGREIPATAGATAEYARGTQVGPEFFQVFDVEPALGRFFTTEEGKPGSGGAAMISYAYWQSHFAGDPHALGQTIRVYGRPMAIVGVLPPGFRFPDDTDLWVPKNISPEDMKEHAGQNWLAVGRLKPGVPLESAQAEMTIIARRLEQQYPEANKDRTVGIRRLRDKMVEVIPETRGQMSDFAPRITTIKINPERIRDIIGKGGSMIRKIQEETSTEINVEDDGSVEIAAVSGENARKAITWIESLTRDVEVGALYLGKVTRIMGFGAFVEILPGKEGLVRIGELADYHVPTVEDVVSVGDEVMVVVIEVDRQGRINLSRKAAMQRHLAKEPVSPA
jgi:hypothetical protein